ncbi:MAG: APC family permease [Gammaproteobacteria bacterium]|nr:APC family permease [Gammaproteobacteria bacterium]
MELSRRFSPFHLLMLSINGMVGSAWLFAPFYAAKIAGSGAIISWLIGGIATTCIALTFAELSVLFPVAGGTAQIPQLSHGMFTSFVLSWLAWLSALTMAPIEVQAVLLYASTYFSSLTHVVDGAPVLSGTGIFWASILMLIFCIINAVSFKGLIRFNFILFLFKITVIIIAIVTLIRFSFHPVNFTYIPGHSFGWQAILTAVATGGIAFAFTGFKHGVELAGEAKQLAISIPLAIVGSVLCCLVLYIGLQVAFIGALNPSSLIHGWQQLNFSGDVGPFAGLAAGLGLIWLLNLLYIDATVSPSGAGLIYVTSTARILYAMSRIGYLPHFLTYLNKQGFPVVAIAVNFIIGMFLFLPLPGWQSMVSFLVSGMVLSYAIGPIALICLRLELPQATRQFRLPAAHLVCLLAFYFCNLMSYWTGWETVSKLAVAILIGLVVFSLTCLKNKKSVNSLGFKSGMWVVPYLMGLILISYLGAFGGKQIIPFGWDFLIIGLFSMVFFYVAIYCRSKGLSQDYRVYQKTVGSELVSEIV